MKVGGEPIFLTRTKGGEIKAFKNVCRHRGCQLVMKDGRYPLFSCQYHRWGYSLDGQLKKTPQFDLSQEFFDKYTHHTARWFTRRLVLASLCAVCLVWCVIVIRSKYSLFPVRVDSWGHLVFVNLSGDAPDLKTYLGPSHYSTLIVPRLVSSRFKSRSSRVCVVLLCRRCA